MAASSRWLNMKLESFIKRKATYVGKITRANDEELPKKFLGAWMHQPRKVGGLQLSWKNNFSKAISAVVPCIHSEHQGLLFKNWIPLALNESDWLNTINAYFESCKTIDEDRKEEKDPNSTDPQDTIPHVHMYTRTKQTKLKKCT